MLTKLQLPQALIGWVDSFLTDRKIQLAFEGQHTAMTPVATGIPQGSSISPILFLIYIRDILAIGDFRGAQLLQLSYIDDFCIATSSTSAKLNYERLEKVAAGLVAQATESRAQFDPSKTELIHFTTHRTLPTEGITIAGLVVAPKSIVR